MLKMRWFAVVRDY